MTMTSVNYGEPYFLKADISKAGQSSASINDYIKMRVADNGKILPVQWYDQGRVMNVNGMIPFIEGAVGQWHTDDDDNIVMAPDADYRDWQGSAANTRDGGWADYILTDQMFTQKGIFYGKIGLMDGNGRRLTSIDIWFRVLGDDVMFGLTQKYYSDRVEKLIRQIEDKTDQVIKDARDTYTKETQATRDALKAKNAEVEATRAEQRILSASIGSLEAQLKASDVVSVSDFKAKTDYLDQSINNRLKQIDTNIEAFSDLSALSAKYPNGQPGLFYAAGHLYIYNNGWVDQGAYPSAPLTETEKEILNNAIFTKAFIYDDSQIVTPYNDADLFPTNTVITFATDMTKVLHTPAQESGTFITIGSSDNGTAHGTPKDGTFQEFISYSGYTKRRMLWGGKWTKWLGASDDNETSKFIYDDSQIVTPYNDADLFPTNTVITFATDMTKVLNVPTQESGTFITTGSSADGAFHGTPKDGAFQEFISSSGSVKRRIHWGGKWTEWLGADGNETPELSPSDKEFKLAKVSLSMFGKFGVIGDSYASGVLEDFEHTQKDIFAQMTPEMTENLSWPTMLARKWGTSMLHLAKGGLSTRTWLTDDQGLKKLNESDPQDIYYLCLGINDYYGLGDSYLGIESDMESGADSFYGNYAKIIKAIKAKAPLAKIIMFGIAITPGDSHDRQLRFSNAQYKIAQHFGIPYISENDDVLFNSDYYLKSMGSGHPSSYLYGAIAEAFERLIQRAIYRNRDYFYSYGWNGEL